MIDRRQILLAAIWATVARPAGALVIDLVGTVAARPELSTLSRALAASSLADRLSGSGPFTLFAPNDAAFAALAPGMLDDLLAPANRARLDRVLFYHVARRAIRAADLDQLIRPLQTLQGGYVEVNGMAGVRINSARVLTADIPATNGLIHVIDTVLIPKT
jgi:uncharacterized surface protein with fasciclin (FAS1) repeats